MTVTPAMIDAARRSSDWVADLRENEIAHIYEAMRELDPKFSELTNMDIPLHEFYINPHAPSPSHISEKEGFEPSQKSESAPELVMALGAFVSAYDTANPMRTANMHPGTCRCLRCTRDMASRFLERLSR